MSPSSPHTILGIDPGYDRVGVAIVERRQPKDQVLFSDCLTTDKEESFYGRLRQIGTYVEELMRRHPVEAIAVEELFFSKNQKTALRVAEARAVALYPGIVSRIPILEYTPLQVKIALTGYGRSTKTQVEHMVLALSDIPPKKRLDDEYDAIAIALTAMASTTAWHIDARDKNVFLSTVPGVAKEK